MTRDQAIHAIQVNADAIRRLGASALYLYGSVARDTAGPGSDIDVFVDRDPNRRFGFIELTELEFFLQDLLGAKVELSTRSGLHPALSTTIERSAIRVI